MSKYKISIDEAPGFAVIGVEPALTEEDQQLIQKELDVDPELIQSDANESRSEIEFDQYEALDTKTQPIITEDEIKKAQQIGAALTQNGVEVAIDENIRQIGSYYGTQAV